MPTAQLCITAMRYLNSPTCILVQNLGMGITCATAAAAMILSKLWGGNVDASQRCSTGYFFRGRF